MRIRTTLGLLGIGLLAACAVDGAGGAAKDREPPRAPTPVDVAATSTDDAEAVPHFAFLKAAGVRAASPTEAAWNTLRAIAPTYRLSAATLAGVELGRLHDVGDGPVIAEFHQRVDGLEVFHRRLAIALDRANAPVAATGHLATNARPTAGATFALDAVGAGRAALAALTGIAASAASVRAGHGAADSPYAPLAVAGMESGRAKKVWYPGDKGLVPAFYVELDSGERATAFVVSAEDGEVLFRKELTASHAYRVWADAETGRPLWGPQGLASDPHPTGRPDGFQAGYVARPLVSLDHATFSKGDPWLPVGATELSGNNVIAYADLVKPNGFGNGDFKVTGDGNHFDFPFDTSKGPQVDNDAKAAVLTQLFYTTNFMHDYFYDAGFDEASGNPQADNFGRGGQGGDALLAEGQDYSGRNNANASTPADGAPPRIQMYLFDGASNTKVRAGAAAYTANPASFAPASFNLVGRVVAAEDATATTTDGCEAFTNASAIAGKIALVDRGQCNFTQKVQNATAAGAIGVIIANNVGGGAPQVGSAQGTTTTIPTVGVSQADGATMRGQIAAGPLDVTIQREPSVDRDGAIDAAILSHEWGHVLSNRLVGDGSGLSNSQGTGMGEGWADFTALITLLREDPTKRYDGVYGMGGYAMSGSDPQGYYFGVRRYPYSTDFTKNPLTYKHIGNGTALPTTAPIAFGEDGASNSEVHNTGEIWATLLWECYAALLRDPRYTYDQANLRMRKYLVASLKLTPDAPTVLEARDAVLAAAYATDAKDFETFAAAFARRGAGVGAEGPDRRSTTHVGVKESFVTGSDVTFVSAKLDDSVASCDKDGVLDVGEKGQLTLTLRNSGTGTLTQTSAKVRASDPAVQLENDGVVTFAAAKPYEAMTAKLGVILKTAQPIGQIDLEIQVTDPTLAVQRPIGGKLSEIVQFDVRQASSATDDVESEPTVWKVGGDKKLALNETWRRERQAGTPNHVWTIVNNDTVSDQYLTTPPLQVSDDKPFGLTFKHAWSFELNQGKYYDGGVVEISADGGKTWTDIGAGGKPGYPGTLETAQSDNPLKGRTAFVGKSSGFPKLIETTIDVADKYKGQTVLVRFRVGTDEGTGADGWIVDDVAFHGIVGTPFGVRVADACGKIEQPVPPASEPPAANPSPTGATTEEPAPGPKTDSGCGCHLAGGERGGPGGGAAFAAMLGVIGAAFARRRRR